MLILIRTLFAVIYLTLINANSIRFNNTGIQNLVVILQGVGHPPSNGTLLTAGNYSEIIVLNEWEGSFYTYPEECLNTACDYPVTKVSVAFERYMFGSFYDFLLVDLNQGFNVPASIKSLTRTDCDIGCDADLLAICPEEDQIKNEEGELVTCKTSVGNFQEFKKLCPEARVDGGDLDLSVCASMSYEITFG
ncbi:uncharacterized protein BDFB_004263 [Asbolus verrucosus]|uniref:Thaumatin domain containing protein n=1 Tax=Asbolus verrucosus TaxID=1661398 RepID=A0A482V812_ASBVE|nr:uncharacterized protein BDFB_004263 [Asbolus verrucosus]